jgi:hypothetical protein
MRASRCLMIRAACVLLFCAVGCSAQIPDGRIGCHDMGPMGGTCPAGFTCWSDQFCHRGMEPMHDGGADALAADVGIDSAMEMIDAGTDGGHTGRPYDPCVDAADCGRDLVCFAHSYCSPPCPTSMCPLPPTEPPGVCFGPSCLLVCTPMGDPCPVGSICALGGWTSTGTTGACADEATIFPASNGIHCSADPECTMPDVCRHNACVRPCDAMGDCGGGENCAPIPMLPMAAANRACLAQCSGPTCRTNFECVMPTGAPTGSCFPTTWAVPGTRL